MPLNKSILLAVSMWPSIVTPIYPIYLVDVHSCILGFFSIVLKQVLNDLLTKKALKLRIIR